MSERHLALIGMMGAGKSTVGRLLAQRLDRPFLDSDAVIEARTGKTVAQIFREQGELAFRDLEAEAVASAVSSATPVVIGVAGGAVKREETRRILADQTVVIWLQAPIELLIQRVIGRKVERPMITEDPEGSMRRLYQERQPLYAQLAQLTIDVSTGKPDTIASKIVEVLP